MKRRAAGQLEYAVLQVLWDGGKPMTPGEVHAVLGVDGPLAYTTVMTILSRLWKKGSLTRSRAGRAYVYSPAMSRESTAAVRMSQILLNAGDPSMALAQFVESLSPDQQADLRKVLRRRVQGR